MAPELLGLYLLRDGATGLSGGRIVEVEAYGGPDDRASHARAGLTARTASMFGPPGHAYVYLVYGLHHCLNVVTETDGRAGAVLIRALEPVIGIDLIRLRRERPHEPDFRLAAGPARLCQALAIDRRLDGIDLCAGERLWLSRAPGDSAGDEPPAAAGSAAIVSGRRVGVEYAGEEWAARAWRFGLAGHPSLSRAFPRAAQAATSAPAT